MKHLCAESTPALPETRASEHRLNELYSMDEYPGGEEIELDARYYLLTEHTYECIGHADSGQDDGLTSARQSSEVSVISVLTTEGESM